MFEPARWLCWIYLPLFDVYRHWIRRSLVDFTFNLFTLMYRLLVQRSASHWSVLCRSSDLQFNLLRMRAMHWMQVIWLLGYIQESRKSTGSFPPLGEVSRGRTTNSDIILVKAQTRSGVAIPSYWNKMFKNNVSHSGKIHGGSMPDRAELIITIQKIYQVGCFWLAMIHGSKHSNYKRHDGNSALDFQLEIGNSAQNTQLSSGLSTTWYKEFVWGFPS